LKTFIKSLGSVLCSAKMLILNADHKPDFLHFGHVVKTQHADLDSKILQTLFGWLKTNPCDRQASSVNCYPCFQTCCFRFVMPFSKKWLGKV